MNERIIYLDQCAWIRLAQVYYGKDRSAGGKLALDFVRTAKESGEARFPLSLGHYVETNKHGNAERRSRLAKFMLEISGCMTFTSLEEVVSHEIDVALRAVFGSRVTVESLRLLGLGVLNAIGSGRSVQTPVPGSMLEESQQREAKLLAQAFYEFGCLAGPDTLGGSAFGLRDVFARLDQKFVGVLKTLPDDLSEVPGDQEDREAYLCDRCLRELRPAIKERLEAHGLSWEEFTALDVVERVQFVNRMPTRRVDVHLMHQFAKDRTLKREQTDLNDFAFLGFAVSYCDVVVAEKQFASLVNRKGLVKKAVVIASLPELPGVLRKQNSGI